MSYRKIKKLTLHACWKSVWPQVVEIENSRIFLEQEYSDIIELAHAIGGEGFQDLNEEVIIKTMADQELDEDELIEIVSKTRQKSERHEH
jgi:hypothetical protein